MHVRVVKMFGMGVELDRRMLYDRSTVQHRGDLVIMDVTDQGRHRPTKVARLKGPRGIVCELHDVSVVWASEDRITFTGDERLPNNEGKIVFYKQSWLCILESEVQNESGPNL